MEHNIDYMWKISKIIHNKVASFSNLYTSKGTDLMLHLSARLIKRQYFLAME